MGVDGVDLEGQGVRDQAGWEGIILTKGLPGMRFWNQSKYR